MENGTQNEKATADTAEAEEGKAAAELDKFKDVAALQKAYLSLEAEFTRRSQRLKELESREREKAAPAEAENAAQPERDGSGQAPKAPTEEEKRRIIEEYLISVAQNRSVPVIIAGDGVAAPRSAPSTVKEAGALAREFLINGGNN